MNYIIDPVPFPVPVVNLIAPLLYRQCGDIMTAKIENVTYIINILPHNNGYIAIKREDKKPFEPCMLHYNYGTMKWSLPILYA